MIFKTITMKRLIIIVEGDTEKEFVDTVLYPYFASKNIYDVSCFKIKHSRGGLSKYSHLKTDILNVIYHSEVVVTSLIDFYALPKDFPRYEESKNINDKIEKIRFLEKSIKEDIEELKKQKFDNFIPYIQLHEFEALVFSSLDGFNIYESNKIDMLEINKVFYEYPNPEDINDNPNTAPSKRLMKYIKGYNKIIDGIMIVEEVGVDTILKKCSRFNEWINKILDVMKDGKVGS